MEALLWSLTEQMRATRMLSDMDLFDTDEWRLRVDPETEFWFGNRYGAAWWSNSSTFESGSLPPDLDDGINGNMAQESRNYTVENMHRVLEQLFK